MTENFEKHYNYLINFLNACLEQDRLSHSLIFEGNDVLSQYALALEIARKLNCLESKNEDCSCRNCSWLKENKHPAIMTISKIDNKTDESKTVISEEQITSLLDTLINPSDFHRVFIFCNAEIKKLTELEEKRYNRFKAMNFKAPQEATEQTCWYPSGLNEECFQSVAQNSMLKSIEEPPKNVTFIFLTENKNDLLQTIISRSQSFFVPSFGRMSFNTEFFETELKYYPEFSRDEAIPFSQKILKYQTENHLAPSYILDCMQEYIKNMLSANLSNTQFVQKAYKDIEKIETSKKMLKAYLKDSVVYEDLAFYLVNE